MRLRLGVVACRATDTGMFGGSFSIGVTGGSKIGNFATPSVDHLRELMRRAYTDRQATREMGRRAAAWMHAEWNYDRCAEKWLQAVARLAEASPQPHPELPDRA